MSTQSALYIGEVMHHRLRPRRHKFNYRVFSMLINLDELPVLSAASRLFGYNKRALVSFHDTDHGDGTVGGLRQWVEAQLRDADVPAENVSITVLCYPRVLGYAFNPLTVYFCRAADGALCAILYEVSNTFGERHTYIIRGREEANGVVEHACAKEFYVSPFIPMACTYRFHIELPDEHIIVRIDEADADGPLLVASFTGHRRAFSDASLFATLLRHPLMFLKVTAGIYWEALRIWRKGIPIYRHQAAAAPIDRTIVSSDIPGCKSP